MMKHIYINKDNNKTLVLFHGTGGDEKGLISIAEQIDNQANILGIRGNVSENGMNRFFKRQGMGNYDLVSFHFESENIMNFLLEASKEYNFDMNELIAIGFSNGANIIQGLMQNYEKTFKTIILLSPALIDKDKEILTNNTNVFIATSYNDPYSNVSEIEHLIKMLSIQNTVEVSYKNIGHNLSTESLTDVKNWLKTFN